MFNVKTMKSCPLDDLPGGVTGGRRGGQSLCSGLLCGGYDSSTEQSCLMLDPLTGAFTTTSVSLREKRKNHLCWDVEGENGPTLLMGGAYSQQSTELVSSDGFSSSAGFTLKYKTE